MITEIGAALSSLKVTTDIVKGLNAAYTETKLNEVKLELQRALLDAMQALMEAQQSEAASSERIRKLEQQIVDMKDWSAQKQRYQLYDVGRGAFAYAPKPGMENGEPPHWLCASCFDHGRKSFLQFKGQDRLAGGGRSETSTYACDQCRGTLKVYYNVNPAKLAEKVSQA